MNTSTEQPGISRRQLLRYGLLGTLVLATAGGMASVTRTLRSGPGTGYRQLRESHIPLLPRSIPVNLDGALPAADSDAHSQPRRDRLGRDPGRWSRPRLLAAAREPHPAAAALHPGLACGCPAGR